MVIGLWGYTAGREDVIGRIVRVAELYGVDPALALAVAQVESGMNQNARGSSGEVGIFQLMPSTARALGVDPYDEEQNIVGGVRYLSEMLSLCGGDPYSALLAYNSGPDACTRGNVPVSSRSYARRVLAARDRWASVDVRAYAGGRTEGAVPAGTAGGTGQLADVDTGRLAIFLSAAAVVILLVAAS